MRSGVGLVVLVMTLGACQAGGLEIIVFPPADPGAKKIDEIRVYTGVGTGQMTRMGTVGFTPDRNRRGGLWARDLDADALPFQSKKLSRDDESAEFVYAARADGERLSVIALGLTSGEVTSAIGTFELAVPSDFVAVYRVGLNAAGHAKPTSTEMTQVELWGVPNAETCVQLIDHGGYSDARYPISFITTPHDEDCDGLVAGTPEECDDHFYKGFVKPSTSTLTCLDASDIGTVNQPIPACRVGGPICADGTPAASHSACSVAHPYCAPLSVCAQCPDSKSDHPFEECAIDPLTADPTGTGSRIKCTLPTARDGGGNVKVCPHTLAIPISYLLSGPQTCANPSFHGPNKDDGWRGRIDVGGASYALTSTTSGGTSCAVAGTTTKLPDDLSAFPYGGLLSIDLTDSRGAVAPIVLDLADAPQGGGACPTTTVTVTCQQSNSSGTLEVRGCLEQAPASN